MTFEILISTMHKKTNEVLSLIKHSNVKCNALVIVQGDTEGYEEVKEAMQIVRIFFTKERGLSKSRNMALKNSTAEIVLLADDDLIYFDNFEQEIVSSFKEHKGYQFLIFNVDNYNRTYSSIIKSVLWHHVLGFASFQIAFKRQEVVNKNIFFNEFFGTGSGIYSSGEENIFLSECYKYFKMLYLPQKILKRPSSDSSWFTGYNDKYLFDRGAIFYAISPGLSYLLILQFALRRKSLFPEYSLTKVLRIMFKGLNNCRSKKYYKG